jgi:thiamine kinase-like enzyme
MLDQHYKKYSISPIGEPILNWHILLRNRFDRTESLKHWNKREKIGNGIVNQVYKTSVDSGNVYTVKLLEKNTEELGIDRLSEKYNSEVAYFDGVGPKVIELNTNTNVLVTDYIDGQVLTNDNLNLKNVSKIITNIKLLHEGPSFLNDFDIFDKLNLFLSVCKSNKYKTNGNFIARRKHLKLINKIKKSLSNYDGKIIAPCHNDLWSSNVILSDGNVTFIDYEYSGNNDILYELGQFWNESGFSESYIHLIISEYFGEDVDGFAEIAELYSIVANYTWSVWGIIQSNKSKIDYDYKKYSIERYERANRKLNKKYIKKLLSNIP